MSSRGFAGAILAGGQSRRFGAPKATAVLGGEPLVRHVYRALAAATEPVVVVSHLELADALPGVPTLADRWPAGAALAGIEAALSWAEQHGLAGALCVGCDLPFLAPSLLRALLQMAAHDGGAQAVVPESGGRHGFEPLCACYAVSALPVVRARLERAQHGLAGLVAELRHRRLPLAQVRAHGEPDVLFLNLNTPADYDHALRLWARRPSERAG